jgi:hypothetical protein
MAVAPSGLPVPADVLAYFTEEDAVFVVGLADAVAGAGGGGVGADEDDADELPPPPLDEFVERIRRDDVGCGFRSNACRGIVVQTLLTALLLANLNMVAWILTVDLRRFVEFALWLLFSVACACRFLFSLSFYVNFQTDSQPRTKLHPPSCVLEQAKSTRNMHPNQPPTSFPPPPPPSLHPPLLPGWERALDAGEFSRCCRMTV